MRHCLLSLILVCLAISGVSETTAECFSSQQPILRNTSNRPGPIAWTGSFLAMAALNSTSNGIDFVRFDSNLVPADTRRVVDSSQEGAFALVWTGTEFGLFYQDAERFEVLQRLTSTGEKIGTPIRLLTAPTAPRQTYDVEWNGTRYVIARTNLSRNQDRGLYVTVVNGDGSIFINQALGSSASNDTDRCRRERRPAGAGVDQRCQ